MVSSSVQPISTTSLLISLLIGMLALYSAWTNLFKKKITTFGPDALVFFLVRLITKKRTEKLLEDRNLPIRMSVAMMLIVFSTLRLAFLYFMQK